jgi:hypothetical protein
MWRKVYTREDPSVFPKGAAPYGDWIHLNLLKQTQGHRIRVTVEEEVSECCEKWRGHISCQYLPSGTRDPFKFCPECGKKL